MREASKGFVFFYSLIRANNGYATGRSHQSRLLVFGISFPEHVLQCSDAAWTPVKDEWSRSSTAAILTVARSFCLKFEEIRRFEVLFVFSKLEN